MMDQADALPDDAVDSRLSALLETIDPATQSWLERKRFDVTHLEALGKALHLDEIELYRIYDLTPADLNHLRQEYGVDFDDRSPAVTMTVTQGAQRIYDEQVSHTGRELLLMLAGKKPFAHFSKVDRPEEDGIVPEELFDAHVQNGRFVKQDEIIAMTRFGPLRRIFYAVPGEEWRIEAYRTLWRLADKHGGWNDGFEKMEGYLLGYETEIDPFFGLSTKQGET
jgi:hypothetical protein